MDGESANSGSEPNRRFGECQAEGHTKAHILNLHDKRWGWGDEGRFDGGGDRQYDNGN